MNTLTRPVFRVTPVLGLVIAALTSVDAVPSRVLAEESREARQIVKAHAFHLIDDQDEIRATLAFSDHRPAFTLFDERGQVRVQVLMMATDQPGIILSGPDGVPRLHLVLLPDRASPTVILSDEERQPRSALLLFPDGRPSLSLMNEKGRVLGQWWVKPDTTVSLDVEEPPLKDSGGGKE